VSELRRGIEGGVDSWLVHHGTMVGDGSAQHGCARGEAAALGWLREEEGRHLPLGGSVGPHGPRMPTGPKVREEFLRI
jgi:hypothetical protein